MFSFGQRRERSDHMRYSPDAYQLAKVTQSPSPSAGRPYVGHQHFWQRALSRRQVIQSATGGTALAIGAGLLAPRLAFADRPSSVVAPVPIVGTIAPGAPFHIKFPNTDEVSAISDFNGFVGAVELQGTGTGMQAGTSETLLFDADMRFMQGVYVGVDGHNHQGTFGFV
jgi:hypothetical protein